MTQALQHPIPNLVLPPNSYEETVIVSAGAPIMLSVWRGGPGAPTVVFLPGTMTHPLFYAEFLEGLHRRGLSVVGVHCQGHGKSPRLGSQLHWANLVVNATDAVDWAADHLKGPVVLLGSSQGGILAMAVAARSRRLSLVAAHNVLDPSLPESLTITRLPGRLVGAYRPLLAGLRLAARVAPGLPVPFWAYLDLDRVCGQPETRRRFLIDPLRLHCYPLGFLAELARADLSGMRDGSIGCPVLVIAASGDPLFSFAYTRRVFDSIVAPAKELLVFDVDRHLLLNECVELVTGPLVDRIRRLVTAPTTAEAVGLAGCGPRSWEPTTASCPPPACDRGRRRRRVAQRRAAGRGGRAGRGGDLDGGRGVRAVVSAVSFAVGAALRVTVGGGLAMGLTAPDWAGGRCNRSMST